METTAVKQSGKGSLLDVMGQQLGLFLHLTQTKDTISFPVRLKELVFYADIFDQGGSFLHTMIITKLTDAVIVGDMVLKRGGKVWSVARGFVCQRFVNYPTIWDVIVQPLKHKLAEEIAPGVFFYGSDFNENVLFLLARRYLGTSDTEYVDSFKLMKLKREKLISRIVLKDAVRTFTADGEEMLYPVEFVCLHDENGKPYLKGYGRAAEKVDHLHVSLSHKGETAIAIVSEKPVGIDLEKLEDKPENFIKEAYTEKEIEMLKTMDKPESLIRFWVAKEACSKKDGTGLMGNPKRYEVSSVEGDILVVGETRVKTVKIGGEYIAGWTI
jgi:phosphopantetheinyl transferase (holo-ACP synthase)